jgi:hypothetical protein
MWVDEFYSHVCPVSGAHELASLIRKPRSEVRSPLGNAGTLVGYLRLS